MKEGVSHVVVLGYVGPMGVGDRVAHVRRIGLTAKQLLGNVKSATGRCNLPSYWSTLPIAPLFLSDTARTFPGGAHSFPRPKTSPLRITRSNISSGMPIRGGERPTTAWQRNASYLTEVLPCYP